MSQHFEVDGHVDWILHFASPASPRDYFEHPIKTMKVGALGTINCLGLARVKGAGVLLASTSEVYGDPKVHPQPENYWGNANPVGPRSVYDEAKRFAEAISTAYHDVHGTPVKIAPGSSTPSARGCVERTGGRFRPSLTRPSEVNPSPSTATGRRPALSATWTISWRASGAS